MTTEQMVAMSFCRTRCNIREGRFIHYASCKDVGCLWLIKDWKHLARAARRFYKMERDQTLKRALKMCDKIDKEDK